MATALKNLSDYKPAETPTAKGKKFGIVVSEWNEQITGALLDGAFSTLLELGAEEENIMVITVPGSFELPKGAQHLLDTAEPDAVICLGCVIQGETKHFDYVCQGVTQGIMNLNMEFEQPIIFGVLTTDTLQQAVDRAGGKHGNKGVEAAVTAVRMAHLVK